MTRFVIERNLPEGLSEGEIDAAVRRAVTVNSGLPDVSWIGSHLTADQRKFFCIYDAPSADRVRQAARLADIPCDTVTEVREMRPADYADSRL
jgi:uncharacterized protein DUF4242